MSCSSGASLSVVAPTQAVRPRRAAATHPRSTAHVHAQETRDDHLFPGIVDGDEIVVLEGNDCRRGGLGDDMLSDKFGRNVPTRGIGRYSPPRDPGTFPGRGRDIIQDVSRTAGDFIDVL